MYPLYWITSKGGIFMRYSYEFKRKAIELFYQGEWPKTPNGVRTDTFHRQIRDWVKLERLYGSQWVHKYKTLGYNGLMNKSKGRPLLADLLIANCCALIAEYSPSMRFNSLATVEWWTPIKLAILRIEYPSFLKTSIWIVKLRSYSS